MTTAIVPPEVDEYLDAVRNALGDLPTAERDDLLGEVEASLVDVSAEGGNLTARLGPPNEFAAELRAAAGLHEPTAHTTRESKLGLRAREVATRFASHPTAASLRRLGHELAPIWWVVRAYLAVGVIAYALDWEWSTRFRLVPRIGDGATGLALIALVAVASVALGLWMRRHGSPLPRVAAVFNVALLLAAVPVAAEVTDTAEQELLLAMAYAPPPALTQGLAYDGVRVENIYPYSRDGELLHDVLLYDGSGRALEIPSNRFADPTRRVIVTNGNKPLFNAFPIRYYEPGTRRVARPNAAPYVELPLVLTPPLQPRATP